MKYKINEIFYSIQAEGEFAGSPAVFVRFSGCNLACSFCDTQHEQGTFFTKDELEREVEKLTKGDTNIIIILTGGEPTIQLKESERLFSKYKTHLESNGMFEVPSWVDYVVFSPKTPLKLDTMKRMPDALKFIYTKTSQDFIFKLGLQALKSDIKVFIQPLEIDGEMNIKDTLEFVLNNPQFKLSLQIHKLIGVR